MSKKLTFLFITAFVLILVLGGYFVIQEARGVNVAGDLNMATYKITNLPNPSSDLDLLNRGYLENLPSLILGGREINSWCDVQYYAVGCGAGDDYPEPEPDPCGDDFCDYPDEDESTCPTDCYCNDDGYCDDWENPPSCPGDCGF